MKRKTDLLDLVAELRKENLMKKDFVVPSSKLTMEDGKLIVNNYDGNDKLFELLKATGISAYDGGLLKLSPLPVMHDNLSDKLEIPRSYYQRLLASQKDQNGNPTDDFELLDKNVSYWLQRKNANLFLRTFIDKTNNTGFGRAVLSDRFNVIDNYDVLLCCMEAVKESGLNIKIDESGCDLTEKRMYVRFVCPDIEIQAPEILKNYRNPNGNNGVGDGIITGFVISNSEVGHGTFSISPRAVVLKCANGMVFKNDAFRQVHLGSKMGEYSEINWSEDTKRKNYELIIAQAKDAIKTFVSPDYLAKKISELNVYAGQKLQYPSETIKNISRELSFTAEKEAELMQFFIGGGDVSPLGVAQAMTFMAHESGDADFQSELEEAALVILPSISTKFDKPIVRKTTKEQAQLN